jgi:ABC-type multidrug transport system fused ATPase/permease subunit
LITHRLLDLDWMDDILMLDHGRLIARGSHAQLLKNNARYAALHGRLA